MKRQMRLRSHQFAQGFTLLETLIAMMIIVGAIIIVTNSWSGNFNRMRKTALMQEVSHLIEKKMTELDIKYRTRFSEIPEKDAGDFGSDFKKYRWEMKSRNFEMPDLSSIIAGQKGSVDEMSMMLMRQMADYFKSAVKEVTLTVYVKAGKKDLPFEVTTYFIDFDKDALPGGAGGTNTNTNGNNSTGTTPAGGNK